MLFGAFLVIAPSAGASPNPADYDFTVERTVDDNGTPEDTSDDVTTFAYTLTGPADESISHAVFGAFCATPNGYTAGQFDAEDPSTDGTVGFKTGDVVVGTTISFSFDGNVPSVSDGATITLKQGNGYRTASFEGPDCDPVDPCVDDPQTEGDECNPCVDDPQTEGDECNPCVDDPQTEGDECNPCTDNDTRPECDLTTTCEERGDCPPPSGCVGLCSPPVFEVCDLNPDAAECQPIPEIPEVPETPETPVDPPVVDSETVTPPVVQPSVNTPVPVAVPTVVNTPAPQKPVVLGSTVTRTLPRTGDESGRMVSVGLALVLFGAVLAFGSNRKLRLQR